MYNYSHYLEITILSRLTSQNKLFALPDSLTTTKNLSNETENYSQNVNCVQNFKISRYVYDQEFTAYKDILFG